jgi:hypothetical protein
MEMGRTMELTNSLIRLNALKHHYSYLKSRIEDWSGMEWDIVWEELMELGNNQFDIYTGSLTVREICRETEDYLSTKKITPRVDLHHWLEKAGYKTLLLSDESKWIIRESDSPLTPAHIHPARIQKMVRRMKSSHVKTAIALMYETKVNSLNVTDCNTSQINAIRTEKTGLSPVRSIEESKRILDTYRFLTEMPVADMETSVK